MPYIQGPGHPRGNRIPAPARRRRKILPRGSTEISSAVSTVATSGAHHETECVMRNTEHHRIAPRLRRTRRPAPTRQSAASALADLLEQPRFEVLPTPGAVDLFASHLPPGRLLTVTASPNRGLGATLDVAVELARLGFEVVPHLAARMVQDGAHLAEIVARLQQDGITRVFVPSGDATEPGAYPDAVALLEALDAMGSPFASVGITGYPESHPTIPDDLTVQAMWDKRRYATEMVSNLTFDPQVVETWLTRVRTRGVTLPLWLGIAGPGRHRPAADRRDPDRRRRLRAVPAQAAADRRPAGVPEGLRPRAVPAAARPHAGPRRVGRRRAPRLHLQPGRRDRGLARRPARAAPGRRCRPTLVPHGTGDRPARPGPRAGPVPPRRATHEQQPSRRSTSRTDSSRSTCASPARRRSRC